MIYSKQPKYKFGEKVIHDSGAMFQVNRIIYVEGIYYYQNLTIEGLLEYNEKDLKYVPDTVSLKPHHTDTINAVMTGKPVSEIAKSLGITQAATLARLQKIYRKYRVNSRTQLIVKIEEIKRGEEKSRQADSDRLATMGRLPRGIGKT